MDTLYAMARNSGRVSSFALSEFSLVYTSVYFAMGIQFKDNIYRANQKNGMYSCSQRIINY